MAGVEGNRAPLPKTIDPDLFEAYEMPHESAFGPAMKALTDMQRRFVIAMLDNGGRNATKCAAAAGYSQASRGALTVKAHELSHNERVLAAMHEEAWKRMRSFGLMAVSNLAQIADDPTNPQQLKACLGILDRVGLHAVTEHKIVKEDRTDQAMVNRILVLSKALKIDPKELLGTTGITIDADFKVINGGTKEMKMIETQLAESPPLEDWSVA